MTTKVTHHLLAALLGVAFTTPLHAQLVSDGATLNFKSSTNFAGDLTIGSSFGNTTLNIESPGAVTNLAGYIGYKETSNNNRVTLRGPGAIWKNYTTLDIGYQGGFNSLIITNGAAVISDLSRIGNTVSASNNTVTVVGPGSLWDSGPITVGYDGSQNSLFIRDGGTVSTLAGTGFYIGRYDGSKNLVHVSNGNLTVGGTLVVHQGSLQMDDGSISASNLVVPATGNVVFNGGTLTTHGGDISDFFVIGNAAGWPLATWEVRGGSPTTIGSDLRVGNQASSTSLRVLEGGVLENWNCQIGLSQESVNNVAIVDGPTSAWTNNNALTVGYGGRENSLIIQNGGTVQCAYAILGSFSSASNSLARVRHPGSTWVIDGGLAIGQESPGNTLNVTDGGSVWTVVSAIGAGSDNNQAIVSGAGSTWTNSSVLEIGGGLSLGSNNSLLISDGGSVASGGDVTIGAGGGDDNLLHVNGGTLSGSGALWARRGTLLLDSGTVTVSTLLANVAGTMDFNGGTLATTNSTVSFSLNSPLVVGNGSSPATYQMLGGGLHHFDDGIVIASNARLVGNGTLAGLLTVQTGGTVSPGGSVGSLVLSNSPALQGNLLMEISRDSGNLTNDHIQVTGSLNYGGSLVVTDIGPDALVAGDTFQLFSATSYAGSFSGLTLPPLDPGLMWNNNLRIDGSITVATTPPPSISGVSQSGANMIFSVQGGSPGGPYELLTSTNVALPLANWITIETGNLDGLGKTALTNGINPAEPERYFRISVP